MEQQTQGDNQRLEFLGDAILEIHISEELYKRFPYAREGILTHFRYFKRASYSDNFPRR